MSPEEGSDIVTRVYLSADYGEGRHYRYVMASAPVAPSSIPDERRRTAGALRDLATEAASGDRGVAELLDRLADAVEQDRREEVRAYAQAIPPRTVAEGATFRHRTIWGVAEVLRGALVLLPIAVTWYGLSAAAAAYGVLLVEHPELVSQPFLLLWQQGFDGRGGGLTFSTLAAADGVLISIIIALSLVIHYKADVRDPRERARTLLKESEVRGILARALSLAGSSDPVAGDGQAPRLADREQEVARQVQFLSLERSLGEIRQGILQLGAYAEASFRAGDRGASAQEELLPRLAAIAEGQLALTRALEALGERVAAVAASSAGSGGAAPAGVATLAVGVALEEQERVLANVERLLESLHSVRKAQQVTTGSLTLQTDAMQYLAKALVLSSERVQQAAQALGDASAPGLLARQLRPRNIAAAAAVVVAVVALGTATAIVVPRALESDTTRYAREARAEAQLLIGVQQVHLLLPPPRSAEGDTTLRDAATSLADAATRVDAWLDSRAAPADAQGQASTLRGVAAASRRVAKGMLDWLRDAPRSEPAPPAAVLGDLTYAETLLRDLFLQLSVAR